MRKVLQAQRLNGATGLSDRSEIQQTYDRWGNLLSTSDPRNSAWLTQRRYDHNNHLIWEQLPSVDSVDSLGTAIVLTPVTQTYYDALGRQIALRDARGNINGQDYDALGRQLAERHADGGVVRHTYNAFGDKLSRTDELGHTTNYEVDLLGRTTKVLSPEVKVYGMGVDFVLKDLGTQRLSSTYRYDEAGRLLEQSGGNAEQTYVYDALGQVLKATDGAGRHSWSSYDAAGRKVGQLNNALDSQAWVYGASGRLSSSTDMSGVLTSYGYDEAGQQTSRTSSRGQNIRNTYDAAGQLTQITDTGVGRVSNYDYNLAGQRVHERSTQDGAVLQSQSLSFDALGRLTRVWQDAGLDGVDISRVYDEVGNLRRQLVKTNVALPEVSAKLDSVTPGMIETVVSYVDKPVLDDC